METDPDTESTRLEAESPTDGSNPSQSVENVFPDPTIFLAGFQDCTFEALRYLTEVEGIALHDPVIVGLQQHLSVRQHLLQITEQVDNALPPVQADEAEHIASALRLESNATDSCGDSTADSSVLFDSTATDESFSVHWSASGRHSVDSSLNDVTMDESCNSSLGSLRSPECLSSPRELLTSDDVPDSVFHDFVADTHPLHSSVTSSSTKPLDKEHTLNVPNFDLTALAQNNPAIASLTQELVDLLEQGDTEDHVDSDVEHVHSDNGHAYGNGVSGRSDNNQEACDQTGGTLECET